MLRAEVEKYMKENKIEQIDIIINEEDKLAIYCKLKNGKLYDYTDHVIDRKKNIWGRLIWSEGKSQRVAW